MVRFPKSSSSSPSEEPKKASQKNKGVKSFESSSFATSKNSSKNPPLKSSKKTVATKSSLLLASKSSLSSSKVSSKASSKGTKEPKGPIKNNSRSKAQKIDSDRALLAREEQKIRALEEKIRLKEEAARRRLEELPKKLEAQRRKQQEMLRLQLATAPTRPDGLRRLRDKRHPLKQHPKKTGGARMAERRSARIQFTLLCAILLTILFLIWHSLPS